MTKEVEVPTINVIHDETIELDNGYYHGVYILLNFNKKGNVDRNEDQADMESYTDEEKMDDARLHYERDHHWKIVFNDNKLWVDDWKAIIQNKRWDVYMNDKLLLIKGGYYV